MSPGPLTSLKLHLRDALWLSASLARRAFSLSNSGRHFALCNSCPRSGTHMLSQILAIATGYREWSEIPTSGSFSWKLNSWRHLKWKFGARPDKSIILGHLHHSDTLTRLLDTMPHARFFIYRDPRDIVVSRSQWVFRGKQGFLSWLTHGKPLRHQGSPGAAPVDPLMFEIRGIPPKSLPTGASPSSTIADDLKRYLGWLSDPRTLCVRFEDLVGERGGGSEEKRLATVESILRHLRLSLPAEEIRKRFGSGNTETSTSATFRKGRIGGWKEAFSKEHKAEFLRVAGDLLVQLGYEKDLSW